MKSLIENFLPTSKSNLEIVSPAEFKQIIRGHQNFSTQVIKQLPVRINKLELFTDNCEIVKSWSRRLKSGDHWEFHLTEFFKDGSYLNKLYDLSKRKIPATTLSSFFIILEDYGDNRVAIYRKKDKVTFNCVYLPCCLGFEFSLEIHHLSEPESQDHILCYKRIDKEKEFEDNVYGS